MKQLKEYISEELNDYITVDNIKINTAILHNCFECDLKKCKGACCTSGTEGAPLKQEEIKILEDIIPEIKQYLTEDGIKAIEERGVASYNKENQPGTQVTAKNVCAFVTYNNDCALCAIDKAFREGNQKLKELNFCKPISCHLWPIKQKDNKLIYETDNRCACKQDIKDPVYITQKDSLVREFGEKWYNKLESQANATN